MPNAREIVLIDDDQSFCISVKTYFEKRDIPILTISDSKVAKALNFRHFQVVLLDIDMPNVSGREILCSIRASQKPIVIMVSGHSDEETRLSCLNHGADFFFAKPVNLEELSLVAQRALGRRDHSQDGGWALMQSQSALSTPDSRTVGLSSSEFRVLEQLIRHAPHPVSKEILTQVVTGDARKAPTFNRALEVMISRLRTRVSSDEVRLPVKALRNVGYVFHGFGSLEQ